MVISTSMDSCVEPDDMARYDTDFLNKINASGISPHRLALKVGACIILIRNLSLIYGYSNGTRYIIEQLTDNLIKARKLDGGPNLVIVIPRIPMISNETSFPVPFKRTQFPVLGAYYITLNRAQGQTLKFAGVHLPQSAFSHGHFYVAVSRCGDPDGIAIFADQKEFRNVNHMLPAGKTFTRIIVYTEIFLRNSILG